jgi:hypothetical protein
MSTRAPRLADHYERAVQRRDASPDGRVWICALSCGHVTTYRRRLARPLPRSLRCAACAGVKEVP